MFKLFLAALFAVLAITKSVEIDEEEVFVQRRSARDMLAYSKEHAKQVTDVKEHANKNLRSNAMKKAMKKADGDVGAGYVLVTSYNGSTCNAPVAPVQFVFVPANPIVDLSKTGEIKGYYRYNCAVTAGVVVYESCSDSACATVTSSDVITTTTGQCTTSELIGPDAFVAECLTDKAFFQNFANLEAYIGFHSAADADASNLQKAQYYEIDTNLAKIAPLRKTARLECNEDLASPGICVDTRLTKSFTYYAKTWRDAYLNLYTRYRGLGETSSLVYTEGNYDVGGGEVATWRYFVDGFYDAWFNYPEFTNSAPVINL